MKRHAKALWTGSGKEGKGSLTTQSTTLQNTQYSFNSRFAEGVGTNPEELVAAAHAGCFSMKLAFVLGEAGGTPEKIETQCYITLEDGAITSSHLIVEASVNLSEEKFNECVANAKENCPISKSLQTNITVESKLV